MNNTSVATFLPLFSANLSVIISDISATHIGKISTGVHR